jgi:hypothetical protein
MSIRLEISLGEAIDKLTILDIKKEKIRDNRKNDVENEFDYLSIELNTYVTKYEYYYKILKKTNLEIWELQDILRVGNCNKDNFYGICDEILNLNDSRYLIKKKLNELSNSKLKEQKGYKLRVLNIIFGCNTNTTTIDIFNGAIRYYSFFYDEINLITPSSECNTYMEQMFKDDPFIKVSETLLSSDATMDSISIDDDNKIKLNITHTFFTKKHQSDNGNDKYSNQINDIYNKLGIRVCVFDEYRN